MQHLQKTRGTSFKPSPLLAPCPFAPHPIFRTLFQVPYPANPLFATLTKTAGVYTNNSHSGTLLSSLATSPHFWRIARTPMTQFSYLGIAPIRRELTPDLLREADVSLAVTASTREDFDVRAPDGALLRGWKLLPKNPNGSWVLLFHGVADNRVGVMSQSEFLLRAGYSLVTMDARAHGASGGPIATYGWLERNDTSAVIDALLLSEHVGAGLAPPAAAAPPLVYPGQSRRAPSASSFTSFTSSTSLTSSFHLFALGESMGAGIVLQSAAADPRIEAVVAEASFANLREAAYDYAGLRKYPWLGKTIFAPGTWMLLYRDEKLAGFPVAEVSPVKAVASRAFPVLLICDEKDEALPCRHSQMIYAAARGPKQLWVVPGAFHTAAYGFAPQEFRRRVLTFFAASSAAVPAATTNPGPSQTQVPRADQTSLSGSDA